MDSRSLPAPIQDAYRGNNSEAQREKTGGPREEDSKMLAINSNNQ